MTRWVVAALMLVCVGAGTRAYALTDAEYQKLHDDIVATTSLAPKVAAGDYGGIAAYYNGVAQPAFYVWRVVVPPAEYTGRNSIVWSELKTVPQGQKDVFNMMTAGQTRSLDYSDPNILDGLDQAFNKNSTTYANLMELGKAQATVFQKLYATGVGSQASPAITTQQGPVAPADIRHALGGVPLN